MELTPLPPTSLGYTHFLKGEKLTLLHHKAIYWQAQNCLILSDLHFGKATHFRKHGIAVPNQVAKQNLNNLSELLEYTQATKVLLLGDLFHSSHNVEWEQFKLWRSNYAHVQMHLVMGNHDILLKEDYEDLDLIIHSTTLTIAPFVFSHKPLMKPSTLGYNIAGHIHPAVKIHGNGRQSLKLNCFYFSPHYALLPAFGNFTGTCCLETKEEDDVFLILKNKVVRM